MIRYPYTFQADPRKIIRKQKSDFSTAVGAQFPLQRPTENDETPTGNLHKLNHTSQTMQTLCSIEMTAISDETIEKGEDPPIINASLRGMGIQTTTNRRGIAGIFLNRYNINNIGQLILFCKKNLFLRLVTVDSQSDPTHPIANEEECLGYVFS